MFTAVFPRLVYQTNISHLWILATSWKRCTCADIGRMPVSHRPSVNVTQVTRTINVYFMYLVETCCFTTIRFYHTRRQVTCVWTIGKSINGQVNKSWERAHDQASICHAYASTNV